MTIYRCLRWGGALLLVTSGAFVAAQSSPGLAQDGITPLPAAACAPLQGLSIPASAIGLGTSGAVVQTAVSVAASDKGNASPSELVTTDSAKLVEPRANRLVVFEVGDLSLHQVREVMSGLRISLAGWFYP